MNTLAGIGALVLVAVFAWSTSKSFMAAGIIWSRLERGLPEAERHIQSTAQFLCVARGIGFMILTAASAFAAGTLFFQQS